MKRLVPIILLALAVAGCGTPPAEGGRPQVVATTTQVADLVRNVAGGRTQVRGVLPPNADPHEYEPRPSDSEAVAGADLIVRSGGDVDFWLDQVVHAAGPGARELTLLGQGHTIRGGSGVDPHWWQDPRNAIAAVEAIQTDLIEVDPAGRREYRRNAAAYIKELTALDRGIAACMSRLPAGQRKLVTEHDALGYYADRYGLEMVGAAIPALSTQAQPSAGDTAALVDQVKNEGVKAIFPEAGLNPKLQHAIAAEADAAVGGELWADTLGAAGSAGDSYIGAMEANTRVIADGLSGGQVRCEL